MNLEDVRGERAAENQSAFRNINERITDLNVHSAQPSETVGWICECINFGCAETLRLTVAEYEEVRANPTHFIVAPSDEHVVPDIEKVVTRKPGYWVVAKIGAAAKRAEELHAT